MTEISRFRIREIGLFCSNLGRFPALGWPNKLGLGRLGPGKISLFWANLPDLVRSGSGPGLKVQFSRL